MQIRHPLPLFPLPLILICGISQRVAKRTARDQKYASPVLQPDVRCAYRCGNAVPDGTGLAQPVGDFLILSAVRNGQPLVLGELTAWPVNSSLTLSLFPRARRIFFLMFQKENGGCIPHGKAVPSCAVKRHLVASLRRFATLLCEARNIQGTSARQSRVTQRFIWQKHHFFVDKIRNVYYAEKEAAGRIPASSQ